MRTNPLLLLLPALLALSACGEADPAGPEIHRLLANPAAASSPRTQGAEK